MSKVAIVTGAAEGLGREIALRLAADKIHVAVNDLSEKKDLIDQLVKEIEGSGGKAVAVLADVSKELEVQGMVQHTVQLLGGLDIMVANAGVIPGADYILDYSDKMFDETMAVNCKGTLYCYRAAATEMIKQGKGGRIIGASSIAGLRATPMNVYYTVSKFAVRAITQTAALEWGKYGITVNAYAPGIINAGMSARVPEQMIKPLVDATCLKQKGEAGDVASLVSFLASDGSSYITGISTTNLLVSWN